MAVRSPVERKRSIPKRSRSSKVWLERATNPAVVLTGKIALLAAVVALGTALRLANLATVISRSPDETTYTTQASAFVKDGLAGTRVLSQDYLKYPEQQFNPPPTRIGFTFLVAMTMRWTGIGDERAGAYVACWASIVALGVAMWMGWRFFGFGPALLGGLFLACVGSA